MTDDTDPLVVALQRKLNHVSDRLESVEADRDDLKDRVAELERVVDPAPESKGYDDLSRDQKVFRLRTALVTDAMQNGGRAAMRYGEAKSVFGNRPSPGHTYDLMELAAAADGFDYNEDTGEKRITVNIEAVNDDAVIRAANKTPGGIPA